VAGVDRVLGEVVQRPPSTARRPGVTIPSAPAITAAICGKAEV